MRTSMDESKIGLIPGVTIQGGLGPKTYGLLVTDRRSIFVLEKGSKAVVGLVLGGVVGGLVADAASRRKQVDYEGMAPEALAAEKKNIAIPHRVVSRLRLKKFGRSLLLRVDYEREDGRRKKLKAQVVPPKAYLKERKAQGMKGKAARQAFAQEIRDAYTAAFPGELAHRLEWKL